MAQYTQSLSSYRSQIPQSQRNASSGWHGGQYGYWSYAGVGQNARFTPFQQQPQQAPQRASSRQQLTSQYQQAIDDANAANESRYQEALSNLDGVGTSQRADINQRFDSSHSAVNQSLVDSGLANTTVLPTMRQGVERNRQSALGELDASLARERNQVIQSRNDIAPNLEFLYQMLYGQGQGGF